MDLSGNRPARKGKIIKITRAENGVSNIDWEKIFDRMPDSVAVLDERQRFKWVNRAMEAFLDLPRGEILGKTCYSLVHKTSEPIEACPFHRAKTSGEREAVDLEIPDKGLSLRVTIDPLFDGKGKVTGAIHYVSDLTSSRQAERELSDRLLSLMNNIPGVVYRGLRDWSIVFIGADVERMTGSTPEEFLAGKAKWRDLIHPDDLERVKNAFREAVRSGRKVLQVEYRGVHRDGTVRWISDTRQLFFDDDGTFAYVDGLLLDITAQRKAEEELRTTHDKLQGLVESSPLPIMALATDGTVTLWNPAAELVFGWTRQEVLGKFNPIVPEEKRDEFRLLRERVLKLGGFSGVEINRRKKDGSPIRISLSTAPLRNSEGDITGIMAVMDDITARKQAEETVVLERDFSDAVLDSLPGIFYLFDQAGKFLRWNGNFERVTGYSSEEIGRMHPLDLFAEPDKGLVQERIMEVFEKGASSVEAELVTKTGEKKVKYFTGQLFHGKGGPCLIGTGINVTERRKLEIQLQQSQKMEAIGRLAGGVAHDFNNLLTVIRGYSDLLLLQFEGTSVMRKQVEEIQKAGERATSLTRQLLAFSRKQVLQPKTIDLNEIVANTEKMLRRLIGEDVDLVTALKPELGLVLVDPGQVEQVLMNIVVNARDAMPKGGKVTIETSNVFLGEGYSKEHGIVKPGPFVMLAISDTGSGMDGDTKTHLFEPFFTTKEKGKGTGLGLSTVYGIVKQSGGYIWVYSEVGQGTTFKVYFPRNDGAGKEMEAEACGRTSPSGRETVLVVEDEEVVRDLVRQILEESGYTVLSASDGEEAIEVSAASKIPVHLVITDVVMPKMGGPEAARSLEKLFPGVGILYMSGYTDEAIVRHGVLEPGITFLEKPFTPDALLRKVREVLNLRTKGQSRGLP
ncbi:MAG: PAS domain S-box protein [Deltaproteobacteria bacterium]|nr:PAS domain S-box protein [Deltaproteobacteria bacterium]